MAGVRLEFAQFGHFDYFNIYRNSVSTAIENLGQPIGVSSTMYYEDLTIEPNRDYYYRAGVIRGSVENFSEEFHVKTLIEFDPPYDLVVEFKNDLTNRLELNWKLDGFVDEQRYYCSETPIDPLNLPTPKAVLLGDALTYIDINVEVGKTYYIRIESARGDIKKLSDEVSVSTAIHPVLSLFKDSEKGLWLDFTDMSSMYQDVEGSTPVTVASQQIQKILDKSGNSNHAAKNSASAPIFTADGAFFNGYQQMLQTINQLDFGLSTNVEVFLQVKTLSGSSYGFILETGLTYNENAGGFTSLSPEDGDAITAGFSVSTNSSQNVLNAHKGTGLHSGAYSLRITDTEFTLDVGINTYTKPKPSVPVATNYLNIGARVTNQSLRFIGYIKHIVIVNRSLTALERSNLYAFLSS